MTEQLLTDADREAPRRAMDCPKCGAWTFAPEIEYVAIASRPPEPLAEWLAVRCGTCGHRVRREVLS